MSKWKERYYETRKAVQKGLIPPATEMSCERCGGQATDKHHEDYAKPLHVVYLCTKCHMAIHKEMGVGVGGRPKGLFTYNYGKIPVGLHAIILDAKINRVSAILNYFKNRPENNGMDFKCFSTERGVVVFRTK